jgi:hypothetical protein
LIIVKYRKLEFVVNCCVCGENAKYKCPNCKKHFCSISCSKAHKIECSKSPKLNSPQVSKFDFLRSIPEIVRQLNDSNLQEIISRIDSDENQ